MPRPGEGHDFQPEPRTAPDDVEGLLAPLGVTGQGAVGEPEPVRLRSDIHDPPGRYNEDRSKLEGERKRRAGLHWVGGIKIQAGPELNVPVANRGGRAGEPVISEAAKVR